MLGYPGSEKHTTIFAEVLLKIVEEEASWKVSSDPHGNKREKQI